MSSNRSKKIIELVQVRDKEHESVQSMEVQVTI